MLSSVSLLTIVQQCFTRYGMTMYVILGNIGLFFNMVIFSQSSHRRNSCSLYILSMSFCSFIGLNSAVIPIIYSLDHPDPRSYSLVFCKLQYYIRHAFSQSMRTFFVLACIDRYATCSSRTGIRSFSRYKIAIRIIPSTIFFWLLLALFPTMLYSVTNGICDVMSGLLDTMYSIYILMVLGVFPPCCMFTYGLLMMTNLRKLRTRIHPINNTGNALHILRKRDRDMVRMLLIELTIYICTTIPNTFALMYRVTTQTIVKNDERRQIESFIFYFARLYLLYLNNALSFWIYLLASRSFRFELKSLIIKQYNSMTHKKIQVATIH